MDSTSHEGSGASPFVLPPGPMWPSYVEGSRGALMFPHATYLSMNDYLYQHNAKTGAAPFAVNRDGEVVPRAFYDATKDLPVVLDALRDRVKAVLSAVKEAARKGDESPKALKDFCDWVFASAAGFSQRNHLIPLVPYRTNDPHADLSSLVDRWCVEAARAESGAALAAAKGANPTDGTTGATPVVPTHTYKEFDVALSEIRQLMMELDYAMLLDLEYDGKPGNTPVTLPDKDALKQIQIEQEKCLRERGELLQNKGRESEFYQLECPKCHAVYPMSPKVTHCTAKASDTKDAKTHGQTGRKTKASKQRTCGAPLKREPQYKWRQWAYRMVREGFPLLTARWFGSRSAGSRMHLKNWTAASFLTPSLHEEPLTITLAETRNCLRDAMQKRVDSIDTALHAQSPFEGRRDLLPRGQNLLEMHADYRRVRDSLISCAQRFKGEMASYPEFSDQNGPHVSCGGYPMEWYFPPAVELPAGQFATTVTRRRRPPFAKKLLPLTTRQSEIIQIVGECKGNFAEAAKRLGLDRKTVKQHYDAGLQKLAAGGLRNPKGLLRRAINTEAYQSDPDPDNPDNA